MYDSKPYFYGTGRRKHSVARVRVYANGTGSIKINGRDIDDYFGHTRKLYEICLEECANTYFIQTLDDLHLELPKAVRLVGITAGASTPNKLIEEVQNYVRINF